MNTDPAIDMQCIAKMKELLEDSFIEVLNDFICDAKRYIEEIGTALQAQDHAGAAQVAHKTKSSAGQFGFRHIECLARLLEHPGDMPPESLLQTHVQLQEAYRHVEEFAQTQLKP